MKNIDTMRAEFAAAHDFAIALRRLTLTPIVDDEYPEMRHGYEAALGQMIEAMMANGRFEDGNRYGLEPILVHDFDTARRGAPLGARK